MSADTAAGVGVPVDMAMAAQAAEGAATPGTPVGRDRRPSRPVRPTLEMERRLWKSGHRWVAGVDEVGRGAWAGPLSVGVAVLHPQLRSRSLPKWLRDSKALPEERREGAFTQVAAWCADAAVGHASSEECDRWGMTLAWRLAAYRALANLEVEPDAIVIDGPHDLLRGSRHAEAAADDDSVAGPPLPGVRLPVTVVTKIDADATCAAVAAASVLAKVVRDRWMREESVHFPPYGFERNKGYPSPRHQIALRGYGLSSIHRRTWTYVTDLPWRCAPPLASTDSACGLST